MGDTQVMIVVILCYSMSLRKAKQLLQKKKQLQQQQLRQEQDDQEEEEVSKPAKSNSFAFFGDDSDEEPEKKEEEPEERPAEEEAEKKKKKKKKKGKSKEDEEVKEVQKTLQELGFTPEENSQGRQEDQQWADILSINQSKFNYERELRRHFRGWEADREQGDPELNKREQKMQKHLKKQMKKSVLSPGIAEYFPIRERFEMDREEDKLRFQASKKYDSLQREYEVIRNSNDINALFQFTQLNPEHVDSLYDVGEFLRLQGNYRDADNLIQRVIYIYEIAGGYELGQFLRKAHTPTQLVYDRTSTSFFMALFKFMDILGKKGCFRSALEYNKLIVKFNRQDPAAALLCFDYNAVSSKQFHFLLRFTRHYANYLGQTQCSLYLMPNYTYSVALASFLQQTQPQKESQLLVQQSKVEFLLDFTLEHWKEALKLPAAGKFVEQDPRILLLRAIMVYPRLIVDIAAKNEYNKQILHHASFQGWQRKTYQQILSHEFWATIPSSYSYHFLRLDSVEDSRGLDKVLEVYVERSRILWKSSHAMLWVKGALGFILNQIEAKFDYQAYLEGLCLADTQAQPIPFQLGRYANVNRHNFSDRVERVDLANIQDNQQQQAPPRGQPLNMNQNAFSLFMQSLLPWVNLPGQQQGNEHDPDMPFIEEDDD